MIINIKSRVTGAISQAIKYDGSERALKEVRTLFPYADVSTWETTLLGEYITVSHKTVRVVVRSGQYLLSHNSMPIMIPEANFIKNFITIKSEKIK
jgi:S-adenosylmethionine:diacylglycerol 3-amino-3-carboxypropyl transferase